MKGPESRIVNKILKYLKEQGGWWVKIHGGIYQTSGLPDIIGCRNGKFYGFEVKTPKKYDRPDHGLTEMQRLTLEWISVNGGEGEYVCSVEQVKNILERR